jgi:hypothetical protein
MAMLHLGQGRTGSPETWATTSGSEKEGERGEATQQYLLGQRAALL